MNTDQKNSAPRDEGSKFVLTALAGERLGKRYFLPASGDVVIGKEGATISFNSDMAISSPHAVLSISGNQLTLTAFPTRGGVYQRLRASAFHLSPGDLFTIGQHHLRYLGPISPSDEDNGIYGATQVSTLYGVEEILSGGIRGRRLLRPESTISIGKKGCDFLLEGDCSVSDRHAEIDFKNPGGAILRDMESTVGTFARVAPGVRLPLIHGDQIRLGDQILELTVR